MIAGVLLGEITEDEALRLNERDKAKRLTEYGLALVGKTVEEVAYKISLRRRRREEKMKS